MTVPVHLHRFPEVFAMRSRFIRTSPQRRRERGQILVIGALAMIAMIGGVSLVLEGGNAYAHQRVAQNAADSVANAGATVLAQKLGGGAQTDASVLAAMTSMATANHIDSFKGYYTNVIGGMLTSAGTVTTDKTLAEQVGSADGDSSIPHNSQGVRVEGTQTFGTTFARVIGISHFDASADAIAVSGALTGGIFMPVVFPVSMANCDKSGGTVVQLDAPWRMSNPGTPHPVGTEYIVPLCKTGGGSFMILDLDHDKSCAEEVTNPTPVQFDDFPVWVDTDNGNDCAKKIQDAVDTTSLQGHVVMIPICDDQCSTSNGSNGQYKIIRIAAFYLDYISYSNNPNNSDCARATSPTYGTPLVNAVGGNGSSSCVVGWFVRYVTSGPVGTKPVNADFYQNGEAIGVQLIR
jgi:Flp pilus assembly protein TadG